MPNSKPFPSREADFSTYVNAAVPHLVNNAVRLGVSAANQAPLGDELDAWNTYYASSQNINTRTKTAIDHKDIAKEKITNRLRTIFGDIPASALTPEDRNALNIVERSTSHTPSPVPVTKPLAQVDTSQRLSHTISFINQDGTSGKPEGVKGSQIWYKIGTPAIDPSELSYMATDSASPYKHQFNGEHAGQPVYYWLRWENTRGETGPWSDVVMATITA